MNYTLQVLKGRSDVTALRLIDGVNSVGRHDDCVIRIRSSQVSRRHCEIFEADGRLMVRDLGSSNGTFVNGLRVLGQQPLNSGDVVSIGGVALRVDAVSGNTAAALASGRPSDTAELPAIVDAVEVDEADDFEVALDAEGDDGFEMNVDSIPLDDETLISPPPEKKAAKEKEPAKAKGKSKPQDEPTAEIEGGDDAVAQFLMDLKLDDED